MSWDATEPVKGFPFLSSVYHMFQKFNIFQAEAGLVY